MNKDDWLIRSILEIGLTLSLILAGGYIYLMEQDNFRSITLGEAYRSAQLER